MSAAVRSEIGKLLTGRAVPVLLLIGLMLCGLGALSTASLGESAAGGWDGARVTDAVVRSWMMMLLFSALAGALAVTREFATDSMARTVLLAGGRAAVVRAKAVAAVVVGAGFAVLTMALAAGSALALTGGRGHGVVWTRACTQTLLGVGACVVLAAVWGLGIGLLVRAQAAAVLVVVVLVVGLEPAVQRLAPTASAYLFTISLSSLYRDGKPELLPVAAAALVALAWIAGLGAAGLRSFRHRDLR